MKKRFIVESKLKITNMMKTNLNKLNARTRIISQIGKPKRWWNFNKTGLARFLLFFLSKKLKLMYNLYFQDFVYISQCISNVYATVLSRQLYQCLPQRDQLLAASQRVAHLESICECRSTDYGVWRSSEVWAGRFQKCWKRNMQERAIGKTEGTMDQNVFFA